MVSGQPGRATVASINDLEAEGVQYASGAVYASAEVMGTEGPAGRLPVSDTENGCHHVRVDLGVGRPGTSARTAGNDQVEAVIRRTTRDLWPYLATAKGAFRGAAGDLRPYPATLSSPSLGARNEVSL